MAVGISMIVGSRIFSIVVDLSYVVGLSHGFVKKLLGERDPFQLHRLKKLVLVLEII